MASRADDRTAEDLRQRFLRLHSVDHEDLWHLPADVSDGSDALSGATYDLQRQNDLANEPAGGSSHRTRSSQKRRSPTEEEVPYTPGDRLAAEMQGLPLEKIDRSGRPVTCAVVSRYESESDSSGFEDAGTSGAKRCRFSSGFEDDGTSRAKRRRLLLTSNSTEGTAHHPKDVRSPAAEGIGDRDADERQGDCVGSCQTDLDCRGVRPRDAEERPGDCVGN